MPPGDPKLPFRSIAGLNAANFFQAEMVGVVLPILGAFLKKAHWEYDAIGYATAAAGLGTLVAQPVAGWLTDRIRWRRILFAWMCLATGACFTLIPIVPAMPGWIDSLLFLSGVTSSFFGPLLGALALGLAGYQQLNRVMGMNQSWNHAGNIAAALMAMAVVSMLGLSSIFYAVGICSVLAATSVFWIHEGDLQHEAQLATDAIPWRAMSQDNRIRVAMLAVFLFHLANAPILPTVALYVKHLGGSDSWMTATVLTAQVVMVPVAILAGRYCDSWGRKPVMAVGFLVLPVRIASYALVTRPDALVYLQVLDGIGAGIYGVAIVALCADLTRGKGGFNTLMGLFATALALGGVVGPLLSGLLIQNFGFPATFYSFAGLAAVAAAVLLLGVPETKA